MEIGSLLSQTAAGGTSSAAADSNRLSGDFDQFLTLLTTQLQHQDPLEPLDSNEFVNQLVSFSQVEQAIKSNKQLESLLAMQTTGQAMGALSYIGHTVEALWESHQRRSRPRERVEDRQALSRIEQHATGSALTN